jgi:xanthine/CO dehydrogenase XdhC/CoxF family maturation factor
LQLADNLRAQRPTELAVAWIPPGRIPHEISPPPAVAPGTHLASQLPAAIGEMQVFRQTVPALTSLIIFGAGNDAQPLAQMARELGWDVTVADPRAAFATRERFPGATALVVAQADELVSRINPMPGALAVVMTHHYQHDVPLLRALLPRPLAFLGLLGPKKRADKIIADLESAGLQIPTQWRRTLHAPVGLDLGAEAPEEVALSILAEMQAALTGRDGRPLRERERPIHDE